MSRDGSVQTTASAATDLEMHMRSSLELADFGLFLTNEEATDGSFDVRFVPMSDANFETTSDWLIMVLIYSYVSGFEPFCELVL